jgi:hypothetical protein
MNERIKELMIQCEKKYCQDHDDYFYDLEKFAELIVLECSQQALLIGRYNTPSGITPDLAIAIAVGLKKHFGVEE